MNTHNCENIDGGGWQLVRHVSSSHGRQHPATDDCDGSDVYGSYDGDAQSDSTWSIQFSNIEFNQYLFAFGDCSSWLVTTKFEAVGEHYDNSYRCILNSSNASNSSYTALWYNRGDSEPEDPWISVFDHYSSTYNMVYGENNDTSWFLGPQSHNGSNVWIRTKSNDTRWCFDTDRPTTSPTTAPTSLPTGNHISLFLVVLFLVFVWEFKCLVMYDVFFGTDQPSLYPTMTPTYLRFTYIGVNESTDWYSANIFCQNTFNTSLVTITNEDENEAAIIAAKQAGIFDKFFIGLANFDNDTEWNWIDNTTTSVYRYTFNISSSINYNCVEMDILSDTWRNTPCDGSYNTRFVCNNRTWLPTQSPTQIPTTNPTRIPTAIPTAPTNSPTFNPSHAPTSPTVVPTNMPSYNPTTMPSFQPTSPTNDPTTAPSDSPTPIPTAAPSAWPSASPTPKPSNFPSFSPSKNPTRQPTGTTDIPTESPTYPVASEEYQFIENSDIDVISVNSLTFPESNGYFNPGFYNLLRSRFEISLNTRKKRNLFDAWLRWENYRTRRGGGNGDSYNDTIVNMTINVNWYIYDVSNSNNEYLVFSSDNDSYTDLINVTAYNEGNLQERTMTEYTNTTIYSVDAYYALYTGTTINKYSGLSICSVFDSAIFESSHTYEFYTQIEVNWIDDDSNKTYIASQSDSFESYGNNKPSGGSCTASPQTGAPLITTFNFSCNGWGTEDEDGHSIEYNFIKLESNTFLNTDYSSSQSFGQTRLSSGKQYVVGVIIDEFDLATCYLVDVNVNETIEELSQSTANFSDWISEEYNSILNGIFNTTKNNSDEALSDAMSVLETVYEITVDYIDTNSGGSGSSSSSNNSSNKTSNNVALELVSLQENVIAVALNISQEIDIDTEAEAVVVLSTLTTVTEPIVTVDDLDENDVNEDEAVYGADTVTNVLEAVSSDIIGTLEDIYDDVDGENGNVVGTVSSDTVQSVFDVLSNVQEMRRISDESSDASLSNGETIITSTTSVTNLLLKQSIVGEIFPFESTTFSIQASKISSGNFDACSIATTNDNNVYGNTVEISQELANDRSNNGETNVDCTIMISEDNVYDTSIGTTYSDEQIYFSNFVLLDVVGDEDGNNRRRMRRTRRRRMQNNNDNNNNNNNNNGNSNNNVGENSNGYLSRCEPVIISFYSTINSSSDTANYPQCSFYDEESQTYSDNGCYVLSSNEDTGYVECSCRHLTFYGVRGEDFKPKVNYVDEEYVYSDITFENLLLYPLGWIFVIVWCSFCILLVYLFNSEKVNKSKCCQCFCKSIEDTPLIVQQKALFGGSSNIDDNRSSYRSIKEIKLIKDDVLKHKHYCIKLFHLFAIALRNDHLWWGICCRNNVCVEFSLVVRIPFN